MWPFKRKKPQPKKAEVAATAAMSGVPEPVVTQVDPIAAIRPQYAEQKVTLGMQGYAPVVAITRNRRYCEYCGEGVYAGVRHVCWGNAEHHMHTLTHEERTRILAQLASKPRKLTRAQLRKLYAADGKGELQYESKRVAKTRAVTPTDTELDTKKLSAGRKPRVRKQSTPDSPRSGERRPTGGRPRCH